jgi:hypothetical protein
LISIVIICPDSEIINCATLKTGHCICGGITDV